MSSRRVWIAIIGGLTLFTLTLGWGLNKYLVEERIEIASERLLLLSNLRREALQRYFSTAEAELRFWSSNKALVDQQIWMNEAWIAAVEAGRDPEQRLKLFYVENNLSVVQQPHQLTTYSALHAKLHPLARAFVEERGYYDFFLISPTGDVHYSVEKEADFATNLYTGEFKDAGLAQVFKRALKYARTDDVAISDMQAYAPSSGAPAMFVAKAMYGEAGQLAGVIALQLPTSRIVDIMNFDAGMRETGETYLVGGDLLMRSNSRFIEESTILTMQVDTPTVQRALAGEYGVEFTDDYRGVEVLSAYSSIIIDQSTWAVMAEIDKAEVIVPEGNENSLLGGLMLLFYSLSIWSVWYIQRSDAGADSASLLADLELDGGMDLSDS